MSSTFHLLVPLQVLKVVSKQFTTWAIMIYDLFYNMLSIAFMVFIQFDI